jgi:uncharacterized protein with beta-barrel porin domain
MLIKYSDRKLSHTTKFTRKFRGKLLVGSVLGAGALLALPLMAKAADFIYVGPASTGSPETSTVSAETTGDDSITITTIPDGTITTDSGSGISTSTENGATTIDAGANVTGADAGIFATSTGTGSITIKTGSGVQVEGSNNGIVAIGSTGMIDISTAADSTVSGLNGYAFIASNNDANVNIGTGTGENIASNVSIRIDSNGLGIFVQNLAIDPDDDGEINVGPIAVTTLNAVNSPGTGIETNAANAATTIDAGADVTGANYGISATSSGTGAITITTGNGVKVTGTGSAAISASSGGGAIDIGGVTGISGAVSGAAGINAYTIADGAVNVRTTVGGTVVGTEFDGITTTAENGATTIDAGADVTGANYGIYANTLGTGAITITTGNGVKVTGTGSAAISATSVGGTIDIGGGTGISGAVSGATGISANTVADGAVNVKTAEGGTVVGTGGNGISTSAGDGATTIQVGANVTGTNYGISSDSSGSGATSITIDSGASVSGAIAALYARTNIGNVTVDNNGSINGSVVGERYDDGTGTFTLNNSGVVNLASGQSITGFDDFVNKSLGVITGSGNFGSVVSEDGSFIRPGDRSLSAINGVPQMGTMTLESLDMQSGATLEVRAHASGVNDKVSVTNLASLAGTLNIVGSPSDGSDWPFKMRYTVLTADELTGEFDEVSDDLAFMDAAAEYLDNQVDIVFSRNEVNYTSLAVTPSQLAVATALQTALSDGSLSDNGLAIFDKINGSVTLNNAANAMSLLSGEHVTHSQGAAISGGRALSNTIGGQVRIALGGSGTAVAKRATLASLDDSRLTTASVNTSTSKDAEKAVPQRKWRVWATALGGMSETSAKGFNPRVTGNDYGGVVGYDQMIAPGLLVGLAFGGTTSSVSVAGGATKNDLDAGHITLYGAAEQGPVYVSGSLSYGRYSAGSTRIITGVGPTETWKGNYALDGLSGELEVGYRNQIGAYRITPFGGLNINMLQQEAYNETSTDPAAVLGLSYGKKDTRSVTGTIGVQAETDFGSSGNWQISGLGRMAWVHEFEAQRSITASFVNLPGYSFTTTGADAETDLMRITAGLTLNDNKGSTLFATLTGDLSERTRAGVLQAGFKYDW